MHGTQELFDLAEQPKGDLPRKLVGSGALLFGDWHLIAVRRALLAGLHLFVAYEEPTLQRTFRAEYEA
jgi:hypothetical protein